MGCGSAPQPTSQLSVARPTNFARRPYRPQWGERNQHRQTTRVVRCRGRAERGFDVGEDLSVSYNDHGGTLAEQAARQAQAEQMAIEMWSRAAGLEGADAKVAGQITTAAADVGNVGFAPGRNGKGVQLVDFKQDGGPEPAPPGLPQPLKDFINFQLQGKPLAPMTGPPITEIENRIRVMQHSQEWRDYQAAHPKVAGCSTRKQR